MFVAKCFEDVLHDCVLILEALHSIMTCTIETRCGGLLNSSSGKPLLFHPLIAILGSNDQTRTNHFDSYLVRLLSDVM